MTDQQKNTVIELSERPKGVPEKNNFNVKDIAIPELSEDEVLLKSLYVSVDPYMRGRMRDTESYVEPYQVGRPITGGIVAEVVESKSDMFKPGDIVKDRLEWKKYQAAKPEQLTKVDSEVNPVSASLSTLGMTGLTAYFGLLKIGKPKKSETVVVSGAAGAVGNMVVQLAKMRGCRVVGTAGSDAKIDYLEKELRADKGINYKDTDDMFSALQEACPDGVDVYFDNVGGVLSDKVLRLINKHARIVLCGQIALYNKEQQPTGPRIQPLLLTKSALMQGFIVGDFSKHFAEGIQQLTTWYNEDKIIHKETVTEGFENIPSAFIGLFSGDNIGKQIVKV